MGEGQWRRFQGRERKEEKYRRRNGRKISIGEREGGNRRTGEVKGGG